jgi:hypothetical protein
MVISRSTVYKILLAASVGLLHLAWLVSAEQGGKSRINVVPEVIDEVVIAEGSECAVITVKFNYPTQFLSQFPIKSGNQLEIKLSFLAVKPSDRKFLFARESLLAPPNDIAALSKVNYEGDVLDGPLLVLYFTDKVIFKVEQGADFRSLNVTVNKSGSKKPCLTPLNESEIPGLAPAE